MGLTYGEREARHQTAIELVATLVVRRGRRRLRARPRGGFSRGATAHWASLEGSVPRATPVGAAPRRARRTGHSPDKILTGTGPGHSLLGCSAVTVATVAPVTRCPRTATVP